MVGHILTYSVSGGGCLLSWELGQLMEDKPPPIMGSQRELTVRACTCTSMHQISCLGPPLLPTLHPQSTLLPPHLNLLGDHVLMLTCNLSLTPGLPYHFVCH